MLTEVDAMLTECRPETGGTGAERPRGETVRQRPGAGAMLPVLTGEGAGMARVIKQLNKGARATSSIDEGRSEAS